MTGARTALAIVLAATLATGCMSHRASKRAAIVCFAAAVVSVPVTRLLWEESGAENQYDYLPGAIALGTALALVGGLFLLAGRDEPPRQPE